MEVIRHEEVGKVASQQSDKGLGEKLRFFPEMIAEILPSQFKVYPKGTVIKYRPYAFGEIKKFNQSGKSMLDVFQTAMEGVTVEGMKLEDITYSDALYVSLLRKISSLGDTRFKVTYICSSCGKPVTDSVESTKIGFDELNVPKLPVIAELSTGSLAFSPMTYGSFIKLAKDKNTNDEVAILAMMCVNKSFDEAYNLIYNASAGEGMVLEHVDKLLYHGLQRIKFKCGNCGQEDKVALDGRDALIGPFCELDQYVKSRVRFGV